MADEQTTEKKNGGVPPVLAKTLKLEWIRGLMHNLGGRKVLVGGGGLAVINMIVTTDMTDWPKAICCLAVAIIAVGTGFSIAHEDKAKNGK
jgi:hypothetical protein